MWLLICQHYVQTLSHSSVFMQSPCQVVSGTLAAKCADSADLKDGHLNNRVCTVRFPAIKAYFSSKTTHTEVPSTRINLEVWWFWYSEMVLHCTSPVVPKSILIFNTRFSTVEYCVRTGFQFMASKQFRMENILGTSVCTDISKYALRKQNVKFLWKKINQQIFIGWQFWFFVLVFGSNSVP